MADDELIEFFREIEAPGGVSELHVMVDGWIRVRIQGRRWSRPFGSVLRF
jgi:hypothetical protein